MIEKYHEASMMALPQSEKTKFRDTLVTQLEQQFHQVTPITIETPTSGETSSAISAVPTSVTVATSATATTTTSSASSSATPVQDAEMRSKGEISDSETKVDDQS